MGVKFYVNENSWVLNTILFAADDTVLIADESGLQSMIDVIDAVCRRRNLKIR